MDHRNCVFQNVGARDAAGRRAVLADIGRFRIDFQTIQCVNKPRGASGSSTITTSDFASLDAVDP